jgi:type VI secretion system protein ImpA
MAAAGGINDRQDVLRALDLICDYYARSEPSSPVPLLLQRARKLASKDFMEIIMDLAPDSLAQIQLIAGSEARSD